MATDEPALPRANSRGSNRSSWVPREKRGSTIVDFGKGLAESLQSEFTSFTSSSSSSSGRSSEASGKAPSPSVRRPRAVKKATLHVYELGRPDIKMPIEIKRSETSFSAIVHLAATKLMVDVADVEGLLLRREGVRVDAADWLDAEDGPVLEPAADDARENQQVKVRCPDWRFRLLDPKADRLGGARERVPVCDYGDPSGAAGPSAAGTPPCHPTAAKQHRSAVAPAAASSSPSSSAAAAAVKPSVACSSCASVKSLALPSDPRPLMLLGGM